MYISLENAIFKESPYDAFAKRYSCSPNAWKDAYHSRHLWYGYEVGMVREYLKLKHRVEIKERAIRKWMFRTWAYAIANPMYARGARIANLDIFEDRKQTILSIKGVKRAEKPELLNANHRRIK